MRGLETDGYDGPEDMENAIQDFCEDRGVDVYYIRIINHPEPGVANVKVTIGYPRPAENPCLFILA